MEYTKEQLDSMSDFEISKALCIKLGYDVSGIDEQRNRMAGAVLNLCEPSSGSHIMNLVAKHKICLINTGCEEWIAFLFNRNDSDAEFSHSNPQRAIACCLLMMDLE